MTRATGRFSLRIPTMKNAHYLGFILNIEIWNNTFRNATISMIEVTNIMTPTRNEKRANITSEFRTENDIKEIL